jgi:hypothetical protein
MTATDPKTFAASFDTTTWVGGARSAEPWWQQWTCNSSYADFGTGNTGNCTSLPIFS